MKPLARTKCPTCGTVREYGPRGHTLAIMALLDEGLPQVVVARRLGVTESAVSAARKRWAGRLSRKNLQERASKG